MKKLVIVGAGGFGRETALMIRQINQQNPSWNLAGFYDDTVKGEVDDVPILGTSEELCQQDEPLHVAIAIAHPTIRKRIAATLVKNIHLTFPLLVHPSVHLGSDQNSFGKGCILAGGTFLTTNITLGDFVIINLLTSVGHDVRIGSYTSVMPNCSLSGFDAVGEECFIGSGVRILQNLNIGDGAVIGAGAVVTNNVESATTVVGVPAVKKN